MGDVGLEPSLDDVPIRDDKSGNGKTLGAGTDDLERLCGPYEVPC